MDALAELVAERGLVGLFVALVAIVLFVAWRLWRDQRDDAREALAAMRDDRDYWRSISMRLFRVGDQLASGEGGDADVET